MADQKQIETVQTMLSGTTKARKALLIYLHSDGKTRIPGRVGNQLAFRQGTIVQVRKSTTERCPQPVGMPQKGVAIKPIKMAVVYFKIPKVYLSEEGWKKFSSQPARAAAAWAAAHHVALADSWGWVEEKPKGSKSGVQMFGLARLATADITSLMAMSGQGGVFIDAPREVVRSSVEWLVKPDSESPAALLERALRLAPALGLATQGGRIGLRQSRAENQAAQRVWQIPHVPSDWSPAEVRTVLGTSFDQVTLINWRRHDSEYSYRFRGTCKDGDRDLVPLVASLTDAAGVAFDLNLWASVAPTKVAVTTRRTVRQGAMTSVEFGPSILQTKPVQVSVPPEVDEQGKEISPAKKVAAEHREIPKQCVLHKMPADGAFFFHAVAKGLQWLSGPKQTEYCHRQLRARVTAHLKKYASEYIQEWDGLGPSLEKMREEAATPEEAFNRYLGAIAGESAYASELEAQAISRIFNCCLCVIPQDGRFAPMMFRESQRARSVILW